MMTEGRGDGGTGGRGNGGTGGRGDGGTGERRDGGTAGRRERDAQSLWLKGSGQKRVTSDILKVSCQSSVVCCLWHNP